MQSATPGRPMSRRGVGAAVLALAAGAVLSAASPGQAAEPELSAAIVSDPWVAPGAPWKFFRGTAEPSGGTLDWTGRNFNDGLWETGPAGFGFGDGDDATLLPDMTGRYSTVYLRKAFEVPAPVGSAGLELSIDYDDGFVAYLNGNEIARANAGPAGRSPSFNSLATGSHEAGTAVTYPVDGSLLAPGVNVLAVVGLNATLTSGDFSLHPALSSGGTVAEGCPGDLYLATPSVRLGGSAPVPRTQQVLVNGEPALLDAASGAWSFRAILAGRSLDLLIEARDSGGGLIASRTLRAILATALGGTLDADTALRSSGSPYVVLGQVLLPAGRRLEVEAGCEFLLLPGAGFEIRGEVQARGMGGAPIRFTRLPCGDNWGDFRFEEARGRNVFSYCEWEFGTGAPGCLNLDDSNLELESCILRDIDGEGVHATGSTVRIRNCLTERTREALSLDSGDTVVEYCTLRDAVGKSDLIDVNGTIDPPARIAFNVLYHTTDDGIDADNSSLVIEGNVIHDCGDQAMSLVGRGSSTVLRNLCFRNGNGLSVKDSHACSADFNTFVLNSITGVRAIEKTAGRGGGSIVLRNSIVWENATGLLVESTGEIEASYCDVQGNLPPGPGNISLDPRFFDAAALEFNLQAGSPCIGAAADGGDLGAYPFELRPNAPSNLLAGAWSSASVALSFRDNSFVEEGTEIERAVDEGPYGLLASLPPGADSYRNEGLAPGSTYHYRARAFNRQGHSDYSNVASFASPLTAPAPEVLSIEPGEGPSAGGTAVVIRGRNFAAGAAVRLGGTPVLSFEVVTPEEIRASTPPGSRGPADLEIETSGGEAVLAAAFLYYDLFLRGDANGDGSRNLSDVLAILVYLFMNGPPPPCREVADVIQNGEVDLGDALAILFYLFAEGAPPEPDGARCSGAPGGP